MKKNLISIALIAALTLSLAGCGKVITGENTAPAAETPAAETPAAVTPAAETAPEATAANTMTAYRADGSAVTLEADGDGTWKDESGALYYPGTDGVLRARGAEDLYAEAPSAEQTPVARKDGERFEAVIIMEGMEETVPYEHIVNSDAGFEMDYDYESFVRQSVADGERFVSVWDEPEAPENYLEVVYDTGNANLIADVIVATLSQEYDIIRESRELDCAGSCIYIEASVIKGTNRMAEQLQSVYIIPAGSGCVVARAHDSIEAAEGFGRRFAYLVNTISIINGQNPVMNLVGVYSTDYSTEALVEADGAENARITVTYAGSPWFHTQTVMSGPFDPETLTMRFDNAVLTEYTYNSDGSVAEEKSSYTNGTGRAVFDPADNTLTITEEFPSGDIDTVFAWGASMDMKYVSDPDHYASVTAMDKFQVETVVGFNARSYYLSENWYAMADMIRYPITINDTELADADAFLGYMLDKTVSESDRKAMLEEDFLDMFVNYQGIMMGDGELWLSDPNYGTDAEPALEIIAINGIVDR